MKYIVIIGCLLTATLHAESSLMSRAYQLLGLEGDEQTPRNAKQVHAILRKSPRYDLKSYHEPQVSELVKRIQKDLDDALSVIQEQNLVSSLPANSPCDMANQRAVNTFLDAVGAYTRVIESGQNEATIEEKAYALQQFLESNDYKNHVALFLSNKPIFDFTMLPTTTPVLPVHVLPLSFSSLLDTLGTLQKKAQMLRDVLDTIKQ